MRIDGLLTQRLYRNGFEGFSVAATWVNRQPKASCNPVEPSLTITQAGLLNLARNQRSCHEERDHARLPSPAPPRFAGDYPDTGMSRLARLELPSPCAPSRRKRASLRRRLRSRVGNTSIPRKISVTRPSKTFQYEADSPKNFQNLRNDSSRALR
jgi:hypothetical protein